MNKIIVEVGSTCTKFDKFDGKNVERLKNVTIEFKKNYTTENRLNVNDVELLIEEVNKLDKNTNDIYVCGTSIFRTLEEKEKNEFLKNFEIKTGLKFDIISPEKENELTVTGTAKNVNQKVAVFVGGGGSTEISIFDKEIKEMINTPIGVIDIMNKHNDLGNDIASSNLETIKNEIRSKLKLPKEKADILILAGGGHKYFALNSGYRYEKNTLYDDPNAEIMMDIKTRTEDTIRYYKEISLDEIRRKTDDPKWWYATRAMTAFVLVVAEEIGAKYIVPTDMSMIYGMID